MPLEYLVRLLRNLGIVFDPRPLDAGAEHGVYVWVDSDQVVHYIGSGCGIGGWQRRVRDETRWAWDGWEPRTTFGLVTAIRARGLTAMGARIAVGPLPEAVAEFADGLGVLDRADVKTAETIAIRAAALGGWPTLNSRDASAWPVNTMEDAAAYAALRMAYLLTDSAA